VKKEQVLSFRDCPRRLADQALNAFIVAAFNFFSTLAGIGATGVIQDPRLALISASISAGLAFFGSLMLQRGLAKKEE